MKLFNKKNKQTVSMPRCNLTVDVATGNTYHYENCFFVMDYNQGQMCAIVTEDNGPVIYISNSFITRLISTPCDTSSEVEKAETVQGTKKDSVAITEYRLGFRQ